MKKNICHTRLTQSFKDWVRNHRSCNLIQPVFDSFVVESSLFDPNCLPRLRGTTQRTMFLMGEALVSS
jgi:hypothetical protein